MRNQCFQRSEGLFFKIFNMFLDAAVFNPEISPLTRTSAKLFSTSVLSVKDSAVTEKGSESFGVEEKGESVMTGVLINKGLFVIPSLRAGF